jgi:hypothetical protein
MGIEPTSDSDCRSTVLKTAPPTRTSTPPAPNLPARRPPQRDLELEHAHRAGGLKEPYDDAWGVRDAHRATFGQQQRRSVLDPAETRAVQERHAGHVQHDIRARCTRQTQGLAEAGGCRDVELPLDHDRRHTTKAQDAGRTQERAGVGPWVRRVDGHVTTLPSQERPSRLSSHNRPEMVRSHYPHAGARASNSRYPTASVRA